MQPCDVAHMNHVGETQLCHLNGKGFNFRCPHRRDAAADRGQRESTNAIEQAAYRQSAHFATACFETGVEYSSGRGNIRETALNAIKGFMAVSLFTIVPVRLYELCVSLQGTFTAALTGYGTSIGDVAGEVMQEFNAVESITDLTAGPLWASAALPAGS